MSIKEVIAFNPPAIWVRQQMEKAGDKIGGVWFIKKSTNKLRKLCYRLHCKNPSAAKKPIGISLQSDKSLLPNHSVVMGVNGKATIKFKFNRKDIDERNEQITVLSTNDMTRDKEGKIIGRGAYKSIPLNRVVRIVNNGVVTNIQRDFAWKLNP
jgi:hypothetical protein